ncbi:site-specific recombinase [Nafulsella turpanensis]|uniref:site-specific recombinase n=1 Tax=Nafulsella turpanensis TaxID=1265690 RepID=UPI00135F1125|nr:site-specific recombinase [Nafulsella turpanensis]
MKIILDTLHAEKSRNPRFLVELIAEIRPRKSSNFEEAQDNFRFLIRLLRENPEYVPALRAYLEEVVARKKQIRLYTELGISSNDGFFSEAFNKISHELLPPVMEGKELMVIVDLAFTRSDDYKWFRSIPYEDWCTLFELLKLRPLSLVNIENDILQQVLNSILVVSQRITAIGLEREIIEKLPELEEFESPFLAQNKEVRDFLECFQEEGFDRSADNPDYKHILVMLQQCLTYTNEIRRNKNRFGASLKLTNLMIRLNQNIARIQRLLRLVIQQENKTPFEEEVNLLRELVRAENKKHSLREFFQENISLLAFQVTENAGNTGEHYITTTRKEYWKMLLSASGGGVIVGFLTIFKVLLYYLRVAPFGQAFLYSLNYSTGFILIHLTHSTLATKQPAMTATSIARSLEVEDSEESVQNLASLIVKVIRTQFIAFIGNVLVAFPVAYLLAAAYYAATGEPIAGEEKALHMVHELHPWHSLALFHAAITGVYLFLAGVISGYYDNKSVYNHVPDRLKKHPLLRKILPSRILLRLSNYIRFNLGSLAGNFFFGFFLGFTALAGFLLGLPLDIRHITFSSGNFGIALFTLGDALSTEIILASCLGIAGIGFMNFIVSFGLAMAVAIKSRQVHFSNTRGLIRKLWKLFLTHPHDFFFPPKVPRQAETQMNEPGNTAGAKGQAQLKTSRQREPANSKT